jgi:predicted DNA-binding transcriptional regulator AlpA
MPQAGRVFLARNSPSCLELGMEEVQLDEMELVNVKEACRLMKIGKTFFYELVKCDGFPSSVKLGRIRRWFKKELIQWLNGRRT